MWAVIYWVAVVGLCQQAHGSPVVGVSNSPAQPSLNLNASNTQVTCRQTAKPLTKSVLQGWKTCNDVRQELMVKMKTTDCPPICSNIEPDLPLPEIGVKLGNIVNKLRCLYNLQLQAQGNIQTDDMFMNPNDMNDITFQMTEIMSKSYVCAPVVLVPAQQCGNLLKGTVDSVTIKNRDKVYTIGYQVTSELQTYLEKMYMQDSRTKQDA